MALLQVETDRGPILVEFEPGPGLTGASEASPGIMKAENTLEDILDSIARVGAAASARLSQLKLEKAEVQLGIKFGGKGKFFFAEVSGEAALTVRLSLKCS